MEMYHKVVEETGKVRLVHGRAAMTKIWLGKPREPSSWHFTAYASCFDRRNHSQGTTTHQMQLPTACQLPRLAVSSTDIEGRS